MSTVIVLGAGPTGLMAALEARRRGHDCTVLEASGQVGGMAGSFEIAGQRVDYGSHRLHPATTAEHLELIQSLLGSDLQVRPRAGRIRIGDHWVGFPLRASNLTRSLHPRMTASLVADSATGLARKALTLSTGLIKRPDSSQAEHPPPSFHDEIVSRFGSTVAEQVYGPFAVKLYGTAAEALSGELADRRVSASSPTDIGRRLLRASRPAGRIFYYPKRGYGQIAERLAEAATDAGASIELNSPVGAVVVANDRVTVTTAAATIEGSVALSTIPVTTLASMTDPGPPEAVSAALDRVRTRAMILVYLVLDRPRYSEFDAHYVPGLDTTVARLSEPKNYRDGDDPAGTTVLCAEIACWDSDDIWTWPTVKLADLVADDLARIGLPTAGYVACEARRLPSVYPVYDIATAEDRQVVDTWTGSGQRLLTLGRQGLRVIDNLHHVLAMGQGAAQTIGDDGTVDGARWQTQLEEFALHTVED